MGFFRFWMRSFVALKVSRALCVLADEVGLVVCVEVVMIRQK